MTFFSSLAHIIKISWSSNLHDNLPNTSISVVAVEVVVAKVALIILLTEGPSIVPGI